MLVSHGQGPPGGSPCDGPTWVWLCRRCTCCTWQAVLTPLGMLAGWLQRMAMDEGACERFQEVHNDILALLRVRIPRAFCATCLLRSQLEIQI